MRWQSSPVVQELKGARLHLSHGPIDVVLKAWGPEKEVGAAYRGVVERFGTILEECVSDLAELRSPMSSEPQPLSRVGRRMVEACRPFKDVFITPMAAVAGAVADELMDTLKAAGKVSRAFVNNGGDIALHVAEGERLEIGIAGDFEDRETPRGNGRITVTKESRIRGIATSGARGRSFSLGIADSVTILAQSAASADAAATVVANAVDIASPSIERQPARDLDPVSDLGDLLVTTVVGKLSKGEVAEALEAGVRRAGQLRSRDLIFGASLMLQGAVEIVGTGGALIQPQCRNGVTA